MKKCVGKLLVIVVVSQEISPLPNAACLRQWVPTSLPGTLTQCPIVCPKFSSSSAVRTIEPASGQTAAALWTPHPPQTCVWKLVRSRRTPNAVRFRVAGRKIAAAEGPVTDVSCSMRTKCLQSGSVLPMYGPYSMYQAWAGSLSSRSKPCV